MPASLHWSKRCPKQAKDEGTTRNETKRPRRKGGTPTRSKKGRARQRASSSDRFGQSCAYFPSVPAVRARDSGSSTRSDAAAFILITGFAIATKFPAASFSRSGERIDARGEIPRLPNRSARRFSITPADVAGQSESRSRLGLTILYAIPPLSSSDHMRYIDWKATGEIFGDDGAGAYA